MPARAAKPRPPKVASKPRQVQPPACPVEAGCQIGDLFRVLGKAHMLDIIYVLNVEANGEPRRFVDLQKTLGISPNTLSERLRELVAAGLLSRTAYNEIPPRVDYQATPKARDLAPVFGALKAWANQHDLSPEPAAPPAPAAAAKA